MLSCNQPDNSKTYGLRLWTILSGPYFLLHHWERRIVFTPLPWILLADEICIHKRTNIRLEGWWLEGRRTFHSLDQIKTSKQIRRDTFKCLQLPPTSSLHFWLQRNWRNKYIYRTNKQNPAFNSNSLSGLALDNKSKSEFWVTTNWIQIF